MSFPCFVQKAGEFGQSAVYFLVFCPKKQVYLDNAPSLIGGFVQKEAEFGQTLFFSFILSKKGADLDKPPVFSLPLSKKKRYLNKAGDCFPVLSKKQGEIVRLNQSCYPFYEWTH